MYSYHPWVIVIESLDILTHLKQSNRTFNLKNI